MKLYAGTTERFRADARMHRIAEKLRAEYTTQIGQRPAPSEMASWQNSLMALSMLVDQAELNDHGVILEYQLGNTSRRLDAMLTATPPPAPRTRSSSSSSSGATARSARPSEGDRSKAIKLRLHLRHLSIDRVRRAVLL